MDAFFISYASRDGQMHARNLKERLGNAGIPAWLDDDDIEKGKAWWNTINEVLRGCAGVLVVVTPGALESHYVTYEWATAHALQKDVIPLLFQDVPKTGNPLFTLQCWDFWNAKEDDWKGLIDRSHTIRAGKNIHPTILAAEAVLLQPNPSAWRGAIEALEGLRDAKAIDALARQVDSLQEGVSLLASLALAHRTDYRDPRAVPGIERGIQGALRGLPSNSISNHEEELIETLGRIEGQDAIEALDRLINGTENTLAIDRSLRVLGQRNDTAAIVPVLVSYVRKHELGPIEVAAEILGRIGDYSITPDLVQRLEESPELTVRMVTIDALGKLQNPASVETLRRKVVPASFPSLLGEEANAIVRALFDIGGSEAREVLERLQAYLVSHKEELSIPQNRLLAMLNQRIIR